ncbi:sigma-54-dependent Fis family transcriptional regulator [bacterium]|nr:sigma-54-dependent Fis family transcriptional regulator [bacterium]
MSKVLIIDDEKKIVKLLSDKISGEGHNVQTSLSAEEGLGIIKKSPPDIVLCDLKLGGMDGLELLRAVKKEYPQTDFIIMTAYASAKTAVTAMKEGAYEYLIKPFQMEEVLLLIKRIQERQNLVAQNDALKKNAALKETDHKIIGSSREITNIKAQIQKVAVTDTPVLIQGESGTGKELAAELIHSESLRTKNPFIILNCAAIPETLMESELFGHEKGAFTDASTKKPGLFSLADSGTLFLDEIGDMPLSIQAKLLRVIENGEFMPLGGLKTIKVNVRIVAATNKDLNKLSVDGMFRKDLLFRLNVFPITIPPLRERKSDIIPIATSFLRKLGRPSDEISLDIGDLLLNYYWPGNIRELRNVLERAFILAGSEQISTEHFNLLGEKRNEFREDSINSLLGKRSLPEIEKILIENALEKSAGNKSKAAKILGITRRTLYGRLGKYNIQH